MKMKLLKLSMTLFIGALVAGSAYAQGQEVKSDAPVYMHDGDIAMPNTGDALNKAAYSNWKYPIESAQTIGGTFTRYVSFLFQDSIVQWVSDPAGGGTNYFYPWHAVGAAFDPTDVNFEVFDDGIRLSRFDAYEVDSIYFPYLYVRYVDSIDLGAGNVEVVDTLIFQFYDYQELSFSSFSTGEIYAKPTTFTRSLMGSANKTYEVKIPLTKADSTPVPTSQGWGSRGMIIDLPNIAIPKNPTLNGRNVCAFNIAFKTMLPFEYGDTMEARDGSTPTKRLNYFGHSMYLNDGSEVPQEEYYNNSFWTPSELLYGGDLNGWENSIPGNAYFTDRYLYYAIHINAPFMGNVESLNSNMKVAVYPNPVSKTEMLKLDFALVNADNVTIEMYDLLGNKVKSVANGYYTAGEHQIDLDITDLSAGVYLYSVTAGNVKTAKKITITQ